VTAGSRSRQLALTTPYAYALFLPLVPLLIQLADVLPRGVAVVGRNVATGMAAVVAVAALLGLAGSIRAWGWRSFVRTPLSVALAALVITESLAAIAGISWRASAFAVICQVGDAIGFAVIWLTVNDERVRRTFFALFFASGIAECAFAITLTISRHPPAAFAYVHGRASGTFFQPNELAGYLLFLIPLGLAQWAAPVWLRRLGLAAAAAGAIALAMSASRAAILGLIFAMPILVRRFGRRALIGYGIAAAITLALGLTVARDVAHDPSENASRIAVWRGAARMAQRFALVGVGPVAFSLAYPFYKMPDAQVDEVHAHDLPLNVLIENGAVGLAAFIFAVVASVRAARTWGSRIPPSDRERGMLFAALGTAFVASAVQNSVDLVTTFVFLMWWPMMGLMLGICRSPVDDARAA
jgi:hypothetical protein